MHQKMFTDDDVYQEELKYDYSSELETRIEDMALEGYDDGDEIILRCIPIKEISYKPKTGWAIYDCEIALKEEEKKLPETFKMFGIFISPLDIGQTYEVFGEVKEKNKKALSVKTIKKIKPLNKRGIVSYLKTFEGMGSLAEVIYEEYEEKSLEIIKEKPLELLSISPAIYKDLVLTWQQIAIDMRDDQEILPKLMFYGLKLHQAKELYNEYGGKILDRINNNPYFLAKEVSGYSFIKCDKIAKKMGFDPKSPLRINEAIINILYDFSFKGHTFVPKNELVENVKSLLDIKLSLNEMKKIYKDYSDKKIFKYKYGEISYKFSTENLRDALAEYDLSNSKKQKENAKFKILEFSEKEIIESLDNIINDGRVIIEGEKVFLKVLYDAELSISESIKDLNNSFKKTNLITPEMLDEFLLKKGFILEEKQRKAVLDICSGFGGIFIINGSAGCGKTFTLNIVLELLNEMYLNKTGFFEVLVMAPTGKAAKVAAKATNKEALTIHRGLGYSPEGFFYNEFNKLPFDCIVIDESSMLDIYLAKDLFDAIPSNAKVIMLGDTKQLPSIGAGNILRDFIESNKINTITLNVVKRQGKDSGIVKNANRIINKEMITSEKETNDAFVLKSETDLETREKILNYMKKLIPKYGIEEVQILVPQKEGILGTNTLNYIIQQTFNNQNNELVFLNKEVDIGEPRKVLLNFKKGDKIIHTRNNYTLPWYKIVNKKLVLNEKSLGVTNGECGTILKLIEEVDELGNLLRKIIVKYDDKIIVYEDDFNELEHAYALTIHKSQGSEWKSIIIPLSKQSINMLDNNILYTAYTRSREFCLTIGSIEILKYAINNFKNITRYTDLKNKL